VTCEDAKKSLTAYLDGELADERGSAIRGHLRGCAACQQASRDEAALRDGLRALPPIDPPSSLWAGVQQRLAAAEVADAERPAWRRLLARFTPIAPRLGLVAAGVAIAATIIVWKAGRASHDEPVVAQDVPSPIIAPTHTAPAPAPAGDDVTKDLAGEADRITQSYADAASELLALAKDSRGRWSEDQQHTFDARIAELQKAVTTADAGRARQKAYRALIRYLQNATVRDQVALAGGGQ
jgi:anti-sigma factor RsiW